ncbi:response regulator [Salsipaludibacter albus]|uniref:response regulator n=1 Tax=Salsipaludibacter albus TaxID=2849650 RepID=UPI001EE3D1DE|nr:response regulator [Salsipaludibacter albus]MBY5163259.1 response regulator [Salsipaludibacter albus]
MNLRDIMGDVVPPTAVPGPDGGSDRADHGPAVPFAEVRRRAVRAVAHAVRTPLSLVAAPLELLDAATELGDRERHHLAIARDNVARVRDEFERLAEVACWPSVLRPRPTDVATLVRTVVTPLQCRLHDRCLAVDLPVTGESSLDHATVGWALEVLVEDVAARTEPGARIDITTTADSDGMLRVVVRTPCGDGSGPGDAAAEPAGPLVAAAHEVVTAQAGSVTMAPGRVELCLPITSPSSPTGPTSPDPVLDGDVASSRRPARTSRDAAAGGAARRDGAEGPAPARVDTTCPADRPVVLMVEDDDQLRALLDAVLAEEYRVESVGTAEEALERVRLVQPDLVVCDVVLPGASGEELVEALGHQPDLADVPVVMLTGRTDEELRVRLLRHGADDYLTKPFAVAELRARIANLAGRRRDASTLRDRLEDTERLTEQLQRALDSRVVIEQAKAFVAADRGIGVEEAFCVLRGWARAHEARLHDVARAIVDTDFRP